MAKNICSVDGCDDPARARGFCKHHWHRWNKWGDPLGEAPKLSKEERFWAKVDKAGDDECWEWTAGRARQGYGKFRYDYAYLSAHRVSYELAHGPIPDGLSVCHRCDNPPCCNPAHLFVGTTADNARDKVAKGRQARGSTMANAFLTEAQVSEARQMRADGASVMDCARFLGCSRRHAANVLSRKAWSHVKDAR